MAALPAQGLPRFSDELMYAAASLYYDEDATQAEIAGRLGVSRSTISRLLSEARRLGIVEITVRQPIGNEGTDPADHVAQALGLKRVFLVPTILGNEPGRDLAPELAQALTEADLKVDDVLLVSSGLTLYQAVQESLPQLAGVLIAPTVGGQEEPEPWYQTNLLTASLAARTGAHAVYLNAPAMPSRALRRSLLNEDSFLRVQQMWERASAALVGVGTALGTRRAIPSFVAAETPSLRRAVGDVCSRFYDDEGRPVRYPGSERLIGITLAALQRIPSSIAVAAGSEKVPAIIAGARAGYFNQLVTDRPTALALLASISGSSQSGV